jgi:hypothetical protein
VKNIIIMMCGPPFIEYNVAHFNGVVRGLMEGITAWCEAARRLVGKVGGAVPSGSQMSVNVNLSNDSPVLVLSQASVNLNLGSFSLVWVLTTRRTQTEPKELFSLVPFRFTDFPKLDHQSSSGFGEIYP